MAKRMPESSSKGSSPIPLYPALVRRLRLRSQQLHPQTRTASNPVAVVRQAVALQAQETAAAALSLQGRAAPGLRAEQVKRTLDVEQSLVRTWLLRGTLHWAAAEDLPWLLDLLGERFIQQSRGRYAQLGLSERGLERAADVLTQTLTSGQHTRRELGQVLAGKGLPIAGQALIHTLGYVALRGKLCYGPDRHGEETFRLLDLHSTGRPALDEQAALAELARRYLAGCAPASPPDLAAWAGLNLSQARAGFAAISGELLEVSLGGEPAWMLASQGAWLSPDGLAAAAQPLVNLLPRYDTYLLAYRDRSLAVPAAYASRIHPGGGIIHPALLVDGLAAGTWRLDTRRKQPRLEVSPFEEVAAAVQVLLAVETARIGEFLGLTLELVILAPASTA